MGPFFDQSKIDALHEKLSRPVVGLTEKLGKLAEQHPMLKKVGVQNIPDILQQGPNVLHLLMSQLNSPDVSADAKKKLAMAVAYFVMPFDVVPEAILGPLGYVDDIMLSVYVIDLIANGADLVDKEVITSLWKGKAEDLATLRDRVSKLDGLKAILAKFSLGKKTK